MSLGVLIPLAIFAGVALLVALVDLVRIHDAEEESRRKFCIDEAEHRRITADLDRQLEQFRISLSRARNEQE